MQRFIHTCLFFILSWVINGVWANNTQAFGLGFGNNRWKGRHRPGCSGRQTTNITGAVSWGAPFPSVKAGWALDFAKQGEQDSARAEQKWWIKLQMELWVESFEADERSAKWTVSCCRFMLVWRALEVICEHLIRNFVYRLYVKIHYHLKICYHWPTSRVGVFFKYA